MSQTGILEQVTIHTIEGVPVFRTEQSVVAEGFLCTKPNMIECNIRLDDGHITDVCIEPKDCPIDICSWLGDLVRISDGRIELVEKRKGRMLSSSSVWSGGFCSQEHETNFNQRIERIQSELDGMKEQLKENKD